MMSTVMNLADGCGGLTAVAEVWASLWRSVTKAVRKSDSLLAPAMIAETRRLSRTVRELDAISSYAHFAAQHPDMPSYHRQRILCEIMKCSEGVRRDTLTRLQACGGDPARFGQKQMKQKTS